VNAVSILGVVVPVSSFDHSRLIKLKWEYETGQREFTMCPNEFNIYELLNVVISHLECLVTVGNV